MDVIGARGEFNFSDWNKKPIGFYEMVGAIREGKCRPSNIGSSVPMQGWTHGKNKI
jgi:hypothetical protein